MSRRSLELQALPPPPLQLLPLLLLLLPSAAATPGNSGEQSRVRAGRTPLRFPLNLLPAGVLFWGGRQGKTLKRRDWRVLLQSCYNSVMALEKGMTWNVVCKLKKFWQEFLAGDQLAPAPTLDLQSLGSSRKLQPKDI